METFSVPDCSVLGQSGPLGAWPWGGLTIVAAALLAMAVQRLAAGLAFRPFWRIQPDHWTEKARLASPGWTVLGIGQIVQPFIWATLVGIASDWLAPGARPWLVPLVGLAAFAGAGRVSFRIEARVRQRAVTAGDSLRSWAVVLLFFLAPCVVFAAMLLKLPAEWNATAAGLVAVAVAIVVGLSCGGAVRLARWTGLLQPPTAGLRVMVARAAERAKVPEPAAYVLRWKMANAVAFPLSRAVAVTDWALANMPEEELTAICAHEIAHLEEPWRVHAVRLLGQCGWVLLFLGGPFSGSLGSSAGWLVAVGSFLIVQRLVRWMARAMEVRADSAGKAHEGEAGTYAKALERLYEINLVPAVTRQRSATHPHLYDRLTAVGLTPAYARPAPPSRWRGKAAGLLLVAGCLATTGLWLIFCKVLIGP